MTISDVVRKRNPEDMVDRDYPKCCPGYYSYLLGYSNCSCGSDYTCKQCWSQEIKHKVKPRKTTALEAYDKIMGIVNAWFSKEEDT